MPTTTQILGMFHTPEATRHPRAPPSHNVLLPHHPDFTSSLPCFPLYWSHRGLSLPLCISLYLLGQACWARSMAVFFQGGSTGPAPDPLPASAFPPPQALPVPTLRLRRGPPWPPGSSSTGGVPSPPLTTAQTWAGY